MLSIWKSGKISTFGGRAYPLNEVKLSTSRLALRGSGNLISIGVGVGCLSIFFPYTLFPFRIFRARGQIIAVIARIMTPTMPMINRNSKVSEPNTKVMIPIPASMLPIVQPNRSSGCKSLGHTKGVNERNIIDTITKAKFERDSISGIPSN